jgi:hypothetical protein
MVCVIYVWLVLGLVKGFLAEKQVTEECIHNLENRTEVLIQENERLRTRQQELEDGRDEVFQKEQDLENQRAALSQSADGVQIGKNYHCLIDKFMLFICRRTAYFDKLAVCCVS